jgi:RHS repeat-associated protein
LANELLTESWSGGPLDGLSVTNGYDAYLRRTAVALSTQPSTLSQFGYDAASRLSSVTNGQSTATYSYLANSPLISQITFKSNTVTRMTTSNQYDYLNRLTQISSTPSGTSILPVSFNYTYNSANQRTRSTLVDNSYWVYNYDSLGQVTSGHKYFYDQTPVAGQQFGYTFDTIGNRKQTFAGGDQNGANQRLANYTNNTLNQITSRDVPAYVDIKGVSYATNTVTVNGQTAYRKAEYFRKELPANNSSSALWTNIIVAATGQTSVTGNVFVAQQPESFSYDADGNLTNDGRFSYTWDGENRLVGMTVNTNVGPQYQLTFTYDSKGRRIQKVVATNGVAISTNKFLYDGWNLIAETRPNNSLILSYVWGSDLSGTAQGAGGVGGLLEVSYYGSATTNCFAAYDGNGNVAALVNAADGTTLANYEYGPFGEVIRVTGPMARNNLLRFSTKYQDGESDLLYYGHRYYKPSTDSWLNRDPINEPGFALLLNINSGKFEWNGEEQEIGPENFDEDVAPLQTNDLLYVFVQNDPVNLIDELGLTVYLQAHPVAFGFNHSKVTMVVGCGSQWIGVAPFTNLMPGQSGQYYATIGAGPVHHLLVSDVNRLRDTQLWRNIFSTTISPPGGISDDDFIGQLLTADAKYPDNLPYAWFPTRNGRRYNSNSYASGILRFVTGSMPPQPPHTPGFRKPVPAQEFQ